MDKNTLALFRGAAGYAPLPPVSTWWMQLPTLEAYYNYWNCFDSNNNYYAMDSKSSSNSVYINKINDDATLKQRYLQSITGLSNYVVAIKADSAGNVYVLVQADSLIVVVKYNSSMVKQWEREISQSSELSGVTGYTIIIDSSLSVFVVSRGMSTDKIYLSKLSSTGTLQFSRALSVPAGHFGSPLNMMGIDAADSVYYALNMTLLSSGAAYCTVVKYTSTGTLSWIRNINLIDECGPLGFAVTSAGDVYIAFVNLVNQVYSQYNPVLVKLNTSGTFQWNRWYDTSSPIDMLGNASSYFMYLATDSSGNVYLTYDTVSTNSRLVKFGSDGTTLFVRRLEGYLLNEPSISPNGNMALAGVESGYVLKVPVDGSKAGSFYGGREYSNIDNTANSSVITTVSTPTGFSSASATFTIATTSLVSISGPTTITPTLGYVR